MNYKQYPVRPGAITPEFVKVEYVKLISRLSEAESSTSSDAWIALYEDWNALNSFINSETSRIEHYLNKNMSNDDLTEREKFQREKVRPVAEGFNSQLLDAFLASKHIEGVADRFG